jgi:hypothetical protein
MAVYVANVNGDWWQVHPEHAVFVLDTNNLSPDLIERIEDYTGMDFADVVEQDGFEEIITEFGKRIYLDLELEK